MKSVYIKFNQWLDIHPGVRLLIFLGIYFVLGIIIGLVELPEYAKMLILLSWVLLVTAVRLPYFWSLETHDDEV